MQYSARTTHKSLQPEGFVARHGELEQIVISSVEPDPLVSNVAISSDSTAICPESKRRRLRGKQRASNHGEAEPQQFVTQRASDNVVKTPEMPSVQI